VSENTFHLCSKYNGIKLLWGTIFVIDSFENAWCYVKHIMYKINHSIWHTYML
jgi:hypothetical protein